MVQLAPSPARDISSSNASSILEGDLMPLFYIRRNDFYTVDLRTKTLAHNTMVEVSCYFYRKGLQHINTVGRVDDNRDDTESTSTLLSLTYLTADLTHVSRAEVFYRLDAKDAAGRRMSVRAEHKSVKLPAGIIQYLSKPGDLLADIYEGTLFLVKAWLSLPKLRQPIFSQKYVQRVEDCLPSLVLM